MADTLDTEIVRRELAALNQRHALPGNADHWQLVKSKLIELPRTTVDYWQGVVSELATRLAALSARGLARLAAVILIVGTVFWWLWHAGLQRVATLGPAGGSSVGIPLEALRRSLPGLLPAALWLVVAWSVGLASRPTWLLGCALGLWPLVGFVLRAEPVRGGDARSSARQHPIAAWLRAVLLAAAALGALVLLVSAAPMLPSVAGPRGARRVRRGRPRRGRRLAAARPAAGRASHQAGDPRRGSAPPRQRQLRGARAAAAGSGPGPRGLDQPRLGDRGSGRRGPGGRPS